LNSKRWGIVRLAFISGLESLNPPAYVKVDMPNKTTAKRMRRMSVLLGNENGGKIVTSLLNESERSAFALKCSRLDNVNLSNDSQLLPSKMMP
jgi:hypothetical protein